MRASSPAGVALSHAQRVLYLQQVWQIYQHSIGRLAVCGSGGSLQLRCVDLMRVLACLHSRCKGCLLQPLLLLGSPLQETSLSEGLRAAQ